MVKWCYMHVNSTHSPFITIGGNIEKFLVEKASVGRSSLLVEES